MRDFPSIKTKWLIGKIMHRSGPMSYNIELNDGRIVRRHIDHIRPYIGQPERMDMMNTRMNTLRPHQERMNQLRSLIQQAT